MPEAQTHLVRLKCTQCDAISVHRLRYAGRLLASSECLECGHRIAASTKDLRRAYLRDAFHRMITKPERMWRRTARNPGGYVRHLPASVVAKPARMAAEWRALHQADDRGAQRRWWRR